ncbi:hypothetical protein COT99_02150 [Candidatus Falkowbacteria bacterium CG10_big_fil_rev_8_21_14_0_10_43_10]|uniref:Xylose isomerase-like TIM barrel domain-containing protein n=1 Tax=Candidatus Falkowbacteria bacterium CG10_big_fil_rev_8_21_14_0_10_43_10 TaxID=1974567 RepID=A0A2H0V281_9BACT|nr:MAG: hypothetical protein COT99_02150 [Candidatus Falkowbacteria bacterium CG10_big_fil_rev_8_21_14_0_10_43_10]
MGFKQTPKHVNGNGSFHQIGIVQGQMCGPYPNRLDFLKVVGKNGIGFDAVELAGWTLDLAVSATNEGAEAHAKALLQECQNEGLIIATIAAHLPGQVLGDEPAAETLQFQSGEPVEAYVAWRKAGNVPPENDPYYVPPDVGEKMRAKATADLLAIGRIAHHLGKLQSRNVTISGFTGAPARHWRHWFPFPPLPGKIGDHTLPSVHDVAKKLMLERFGPVWDEYKNLGVRFGQEDHPTEMAIGDEASAEEFLKTVDDAGYAAVVGFNFDFSHKGWNYGNATVYLRTFGERVWSVHFKGVKWTGPHTAAGIIGGWLPFGDLRRSMDFVYSGSPRDMTNSQEIIVALNATGYDGALNIEIEDNQFDLTACARAALAEVRKVDLPLSKGAFDTAFAQA